MTKIIETEGIEKAVIYSWKGWDGDINYLSFSGVVLQPAVYNQLDAEGFDLTLELFVDLNLEKNTTTITGYNEEGNEPIWERTFNLTVGVDFNS